MKKIENISTGNPLKIDFDFEDPEQLDYLKYLAKNNYKLFLYKASSISIDGGIPVWISIPFSKIYGEFTITHTPLYRVYVGRQIESESGTDIEVKSESGTLELGTSLQVDQFGQFSVIGAAVSLGAIEVLSLMPDNTIIGLETSSNSTSTASEFTPFCAQEVPPENTISIEPKENILIFAGKDEGTVGSVRSVTSAPGCVFKYDSEHTTFPLEITYPDYGISSRVDDPNVIHTESGDNIIKLLNPYPASCHG
ncbi:conserved hypothetical protein [Bathymodiolus platifrons methanotrophic gill symbiont]|uniref:hypothetical protein n=1 Tax=Bathymodiolus platifrons methanotrophic gill symbiont TaxID=113268 RepID=UPI000B40D884|nr:hypothetical protein [Bathymodiolus platifrons methanotrophic gill symbiont]GAW87735.1 conserved hypothetical protein [Bathymodiolus platifrons methanotrophic gill symbiont]GFO76488.1 hypothetical protein BPLS_P4299 [Bathymodiolus platifrons methanotrophic gill symbiont]